MRTIVINENQRGLLFKNGRYIKLLGAGRHCTVFGREVELIDLECEITPKRCDIDTLLEDKNIRENTALVEVSDQILALHFVDGRFAGVLGLGKHIFWAQTHTHEFTLVDTSSPMVDESVPRYVFSKIPQAYYIKVEVAEYQKARLYFDQKLVGLLDAGTYYFWRTSVRVDVGYVDTRLTKMDICGQEMLTADKVTIRVNFVCTYRVRDFVRIITEIDDFTEQMHVSAQLALREYVGANKLDEILENKDRMTDFVLGRLKDKESELFVEVVSAGVKDIILPGEIRDIMNTVLVAEKRAQANVITRREEVASTRSLLNTAKLMDENKTLYRLKELEYVERIFENVGNINLGSGGSILTQLAEVIGSARGDAS